MATQKIATVGGKKFGFFIAMKDGKFLVVDPIGQTYGQPYDSATEAANYANHLIRAQIAQVRDMMRWDGR